MQFLKVFLLDLPIDPIEAYPIRIRIPMRIRNTALLQSKYSNVGMYKAFIHTLHQQKTYGCYSSL
jgi:hypothetical protein